MAETLYQVDSRGSVRVWSIESDMHEIVIKHGQLHGSIQTKTETVPYGKGNRTLEQQVASRVRSRINKQLDRGYKYSLEEARENRATNALSLKKPMLAKPIKDVNNIDYSSAYVQHKYDGHRCLITNINGELVAYSRQGKLITTIGHILEGIDLHYNETLDGELYCHGVPLQTIGSWIKRAQPETKDLVYYAYDSLGSAPFAERFSYVQACLASAEKAVPAPTSAAQGGYLQVREHFDRSRAAGYEGSILRWGNQGYQAGSRSKYLVKVKGIIDDDFKVVDIIPSSDGWAILKCAAKNGEIFGVNAPGSYPEKQHVMDNSYVYIGMHVTVEYSFLTKDGIPFHPVAIRWREDI